MSTRLEDHVKPGVREAEVAAARQMCSRAGNTMGRWIIDMSNAAQVYATDHADFPDGYIELAADGTFALEIADNAGWKPFVAFRGPRPDRNFEAKAKFFVSGEEGQKEAPVAVEWVGQIERYIAIGPTSDGSTGQAEADLRLEINAADGFNWTVLDAWVGRVSVSPG